MIDCFTQDWNAKLTGSDRFVTYRSFKSLVQPEKYLTAITIAKFWHAFVKLCLGICELHVNNRYSAAPKECPFCHHIESENHFLFECPQYSCLREKYVLNHCSHVSEQCLAYILIIVLQSEHVKLLRDLGMFVFYSLKASETHTINL